VEKQAAFLGPVDGATVAYSPESYLSQGSQASNYEHMKGTFTPIYRVKVPFMRKGAGVSGRPRR
jgi:hypothetical protein